MKPIPVSVNTVDYKPLSGNSMSKLLMAIREVFTPSSLTVDAKDLNQMISLAAQIYQRLSMIDMTDLHIVTCCWLASKLVLGDVINLKSKYCVADIIKMERAICRHLSYCLIPITRDFYH
jgi:hypothetical protein